MGFLSGTVSQYQRNPVSGVLNYVPLFEGPLSEKPSVWVKEELSKKMPELLVVTPIGGEGLPLYKWLSRQYQPFPDQTPFKPYEFYFLKGGALQDRVREESLPVSPGGA